MIWIASDNDIGHESALLEQIHRALREVRGGDGVDQVLLEEVSRSVASYCSPWAHRGIAADELVVLCARALSGAGQRRAAMELLEDRLDGITRRTMAALLDADISDPMLWSAAQRRLLRWHAEWMVANGSHVWCVDLNRVHQWDRAIELSHLAALRVLMRKMTALWRQTEGGGAVGVKLPRESMARRTRHDVEPDYVGWIADYMSAEAERLHWKRVPDVFRLS